MRAEPSAELIELLERLGLAGAKQVRRSGRRAAKLARDLPLFESVWVDALAQSRILTPLQAAEINAGRGDRLAVGPFTLCRSLGSPGYADSYHARRRGTSEPARVTLVRAPSQRTAQLLQAFEQLARMSPQIPAVSFAPVFEAGCHEERIWLAGPHVEGRTVAEWLVTNGRFPAEAVLEIARQMAAALAALEPLGVKHGDLGTAGIVLSGRGDVVMPQPGVRPILRPEEGFGNADLLPQAYDYLAPERIENGGLPTAASEIYACGCLWWHLLTGRPPLAGGNALIKLQAAQREEIPDVRRWAPDAPAPLVAAISAAVQRDPTLRPNSMARLAAMLGPATNAGRVLLRRCVNRPLREPILWATPARAMRRWQQQSLWLSMAGGCLIAASAVGWSLWQAGSPERAGKTLGKSPTAADRGPQRMPASRALETAIPPSGAQQEPVQLASHESETSAIHRGLSPHAADGDDLVLPSNSPVAVDPRQIRPGQTVRGEAGERPMVVVPDSGMILTSEKVRFENIDFVWETSGAAGTKPKAIIHLQASRAEFRGCSFQSARPEAPLPAAIAWTYPVDPGEAELSLPSGEISMADCLLRNVSSGLVLQTRSALAITLDNVLFLGRGAMLALDQYPRVDEPFVVRMAGVTLRDSGPLIRCSCDFKSQPGTISIITDRCALAPAGRTALVTFAASQVPDVFLKSIQWSGQGSLVSPAATVVCWQTPDGRNHPLDDSGLAIAGLVRGEIEFAGPVDAGPTAHRAVRWQAPLQSAEEPGISMDRLLRQGLDHWAGSNGQTD